MNPENIHNNILLTGAGFSANFNGFLAKEMWSKIFNHPCIQSNNTFRELLLSDFDYESVYARILSNEDISDEERNKFKEVIESAYHDLDIAMKDWNFTTSNPNALDVYQLGNLINLFSGTGNQKGFFFTLNQDIFMERQKSYKSPGVQGFQSNLYNIRGTEFKKEFYVQLPNTEQLISKKNDLESFGNLLYIKLHGSYGWISSNGESSMVIGQNKYENILKEPLLEWYCEIFKSAIYSGNKRLFIIGYGFRDIHINKIIEEGITKYGLSLFILNPSNPENFKQNIENDIIWSGIKGYFPYSLKQVFPPDQSKTILFTEIQRSLSSP